MTKPKQHKPDFKARVALEVLKDERVVTRLASRFGIHRPARACARTSDRQPWSRNERNMKPDRQTRTAAYIMGHWTKLLLPEETEMRLLPPRQMMSEGRCSSLRQSRQDRVGTSSGLIAGLLPMVVRVAHLWRTQRLAQCGEVQAGRTGHRSNGNAAEI